MSKALNGLIERLEKYKAPYANCAEYDGSNSGDQQNRETYEMLDWMITEIRAALPAVEAERKEHDAEIIKDAFRNLAGAIKKVCPEIIPTIISATHPEDDFIRFLRGD